MNKRRASLAAILGLVLLLCVVGYRALVVAGPPAIEGVPVQVHLRGVKETATLTTNAQGQPEYVVTNNEGGTERLSPEAMATRMLAEHAEPPNLWAILNVSGPVGLAWVGLGLLGQLLFTGRMLVQWIASEKEKRSVVPPMFWWLSLMGSVLLLAYFFWRWDPVGLIGQAFGFVIYIRNLVLIYAEGQDALIGSDADSAPEFPEPSITGQR
jgi:lipid-A-disaccharide synthase-like uncharacterized protein